MQLINTQNRPLRSELQKVIRITMSVHLSELSVIIFIGCVIAFLRKVQIWTASYGALMRITFCVNEARGQEFLVLLSVQKYVKKEAK